MDTDIYDDNITGLLYKRIYVLIIPKAHLGIIVAYWGNKE
jgi:hypothetical protein